MLRTFFLHHHHNAARQMGDADRRLRFVDMLAAGAAGAHGLDPQVLVLELDVDILHLGQHGDRDGRGVNAAGGLGHGHALDAVDAALKLELAVDGQGVRDSFDVTRLVAAKRPGQTVTLDVWRNKKRVQVKVTLLKRTLQ